MEYTLFLFSIRRTSQRTCGRLCSAIVGSMVIAMDRVSTLLWERSSVISKHIYDPNKHLVFSKDSNRMENPPIEPERPISYSDF